MSSRSSSRQGSAAGSRPGSSGARPGSSGTRPGSSGARPGSSGSRPKTPPMDLASLDVPMGGLAFVDKSTGAYTLVTSRGRGAGTYRGNTAPGRHGASTRGLTACFAVAVMGSGGAILAHVSAYLGHPNLDRTQKDELKAMTTGFAQLFSTNVDPLTPCTVAVIDGENTTPAQREALMRKIFAPLFHPRQASSTKFVQFGCEHHPNPRTAAHGTVVVSVAPSNRLFVEDKVAL